MTHASTSIANGSAEAISDRPLFQNEEWTVTDAGLEHKETGYFIGREHLSNKRSDGLWAWPIHMLEKSWVGPKVFAETFLRALLAYGLKPDSDLAISFAASDRPEAARDYGAVWQELGLCEPAPEPMRLGELVDLRRRMSVVRETAARPMRKKRARPAEKLLRQG